MSIITVDSNETKIHVQELNKGGGPPLVLIHGMFGNLAQFYFTIAPHLAKHYHLIMYDIRSHGKSYKSNYGYDLDTLASDLDALMLHLNISKAHILGYSYGALIALKFANTHPKKVKKLILLELPTDPLDSFKKKGSYDFNDFEAFALSLPEHVIKSFFRSRRQVEKMYKMYSYIMNETSFVNDMNIEASLEDKNINNLTQDILLLYGRDSICLPKGVELFLKLKDPKGLLKNGDHGFFMHIPEEVSKDIDNFLSDQPIEGLLTNTTITDLPFLKTQYNGNV